MYTYGMQNNSQEQAFHNLSIKFAGRGLARQARNSADSYGAEGMYGVRGANSAPLTLSEFENNFRRHSGYAGAGTLATKNAGRYSMPQRSEVRNMQQKAAEAPRRNIQRSTASALPSKKIEHTTTVKKKETRKTSTASVTRPVRRAIKNEQRNETADAWWNSVVVSFRRVPVGMFFMVVLCAVSLMLVVSSSVLVSDASGDYADAQSDVSVMAKQEDELLIALEVKNDLRTIEDIAVNKLGMVKKDLVTRQYISLGDEDVIETFEDDDRNVGLSTLLSAISKGN